MKAEPQFTTGATPLGSHYWGTWDRCERLGFFKFLAPHPEGGVGLRPELPSGPLKRGGLAHVGFEHYYMSGPRDPGKRDIDLAVHKMEEAAAQREREWRTAEEREVDVTKVRGLLYDYHQHWKGDPDVLVVEDEDGPLVERGMVVEVPGSDVPFTCRPDAVVEYMGWVYVLEHKTTTAYGVQRTQTGMLNSIQGSGECYTLNRLYPHLRTQGVLLNIGLFDRSSKSKYPPFLRDTASRTEAQLRMFEHHHARRAERLHALEKRYRTLCDDYGDPWRAAQETFIATGTSTGACENSFGRPCEMLDVCKGVGQEAINCIGFVAFKEAQLDGEDADA